jgi:hypothetical protein
MLFASVPAYAASDADVDALVISLTLTGCISACQIGDHFLLEG